MQADVTHDLFEVSCRAILFDPQYTNVVLLKYLDAKFGLPGGHVEYVDNDLDAAIRREISEEIGIEFTGELTRSGSGVVNWLQNGTKYGKVTLCFTGQIATGIDFKIENLNPESVDEIVRVPVDRILSDDFDLNPLYKEIIAQKLELIARLERIKND